MLVEVALLLMGLALLAIAADALALGAARIALLTRLPALVVGVVIVGFGTSTPEFLVSALAARDGRPEVAIGNVVGSNLANLTLLLGLGAVLVPLTVTSRAVRREAPAVVLAAVLLVLVILDRGVAPVEGLALLALMAITTGMLLRLSRSDPLSAEVTELALATEHRHSIEIVRTGLGLIGTVVGAHLLLSSALDLATRSTWTKPSLGPRSSPLEPRCRSW